MLGTLLNAPLVDRQTGADPPMLRNGRLRGPLPADADELVVYVHGWLPAVTGRAKAQTSAVQDALDAEGYDATVVGFTYPANIPWYSSKAMAERKGRELADWVADRVTDSETEVRIVAHSLGARVALVCLASLADRDSEVASLSLLAAAVGCGTVADGGRWYDAVRDGARAVHNYHVDREFTLDVLYRNAELGRRALGVRGVCGTPPGNYTDHDVSDCVRSHFSYLREDGGCLDQVVAGFQDE